MRNKILIQRIEGGEVITEGTAEIVEVLEYQGEGMYRANVVFVDDPRRLEREVRFDIDIRQHAEALGLRLDLPAPLRGDALTMANRAQ